MNDELTPSERAALRARIVGGAHEIKPVGAHRNAWVAGSVAAALVVAIAGGVAVTSTLSAPEIATTPSPSPTATAAPTPTTTPAPTSVPRPSSSPQRVVTQPTSRIALGCTDLLPHVSSLFAGVTPDLASTRLLAHGNAWVDGPMQFAIPQAGGLSCEFSGSGDAWASVVVVPDAERPFVDAGTPCEASARCQLIGGNLVAIETGAQPVRDEDLAVVQAFIAGELRSSPPSPSQWVPPTPSTELVGRCADVLPVERVDEILGREGSRIEDARTGWSVGVWMLDFYWDARFCSYVSAAHTTYDDPGLSALVWLPGGEWAFDEGTSGTRLSPSGGRATDQALLNCEQNEYGRFCRVDVLVDGNWARFLLPADLDESAQPRVAEQIAGALFARAYG